MFFVLSGEGASDLGTKDLDGTLKKGAMTFILDRLCESMYGEQPDYELLSESDVTRLQKSNSRYTGSRGAEHKEYEAVWQNSYNLAKHSKEKGESVGLVYFKDSDGTNTTIRGRYEKIVGAMYSGFTHAQYKWGVAMVPRPKSEAWFLAYFQKNDGEHHAYDQCARFEEMSGNDGSPNSCKSLLREYCSGDGDVYEDVITEEAINEIDWNRIDMPSFVTFKKRFENVLAGLNASPYPHDDCSYTMPEAQ